MENPNDAYLKTARKASSKLLNWVILPVLLGLFIFFYSLLLFGLAMLAALVVQLLVRRKPLWSRSFLWTAGLVYGFFVLIFSLSPRLQYLEFEVTHPAWVEVPATVENVEAFWRPRARRQLPHAVVNVKYHYLDASTGAIIRKMEAGAMKRYSYRFWNTAQSSEQHREQLQREAEGAGAAHNFKVFVAPGTSKSRLFMPLNAVCFGGSDWLRILFGLFQIAMVTVGVVLLIGAVPLAIGLGKSFKKH